MMHGIRGKGQRRKWPVMSCEAGSICICGWMWGCVDVYGYARNQTGRADRKDDVRVERRKERNRESLCLAWSNRQRVRET